jgi:hypothetical protein
MARTKLTCNALVACGLNLLTAVTDSFYVGLEEGWRKKLTSTGIYA